MTDADPGQRLAALGPAGPAVGLPPPASLLEVASRMGRVGRVPAVAVYLLIVAACTIVVGARLLEVSRDHLAAPHDLVLESPQSNTIALLRRGVNVYSPMVFDAPPFNVMIYPPGYHLLVSLFPWHPASPFVLPRLVSAAFMVLAAALLFCLGDRPRTYPIAWLAFVFFFSIPAVMSYTVFARHDSMALFFAAAAVVVLARSHSSSAIAVSGVLAFVAVATKQSYVAAPLTAAVYLLLSGRRKALRFVGVFGGLALGFAALAHAVWGWGFWWSILVAPAQRWHFPNYTGLWGEMGTQRSYWVFALGIAAVWAYDLVSAVRGAPRAPMSLTIYVPAAFVMLFATLGKRGAHLNYFYEPTLAGLLYLVARSAGLSWDAWRRLPVMAAAAGLCLGFLLDFRAVPAEAYSFTNAYSNRWQARYLRTLGQELDSVKPGDARILVDPVLANRCLSLGKALVLNDPYLYGLLWEEGKLSREPLLAAIRARWFDIVVLPLFLDDAPTEVTKRFYGTIARNYQVARKGLYYYLVPREPAGS